MKTYKILVVDDDVNILDLVGQILLRESLLVIKAKSGEEALSVIGKDIPDLCILDIVLDDMTGGELYIKIKQATKKADIPVIFLTGLISDAEQKDQISITIGDVAYKTLSKPFKVEDLLSSVKQFRQL